jgi:membrane protein DedA with SNARE-associated domain
VAAPAYALAALPQPGDTLSIADRLWWYASLGAAANLTEEGAPLVGGFMAHVGHLDLMIVILAIAVGTWTVNVGLYLLGRWRGKWVRRRWPRVREFILRIVRVVRRHPWRSSLAVRWAFGLKLALPLACGVARVPIVLYMVASGISAATWALSFTLLGWAFGETMQIVLDNVRRYQGWLVAALIGGVLLAYFVLRRRHVEEKTVEALVRVDRPA